MEDLENANNVNKVSETGKKEIKKSRYTALILCWFLGFFGIHRLYVGKLGSGFLMLYGTVVAACILYLNLILGLVAFTVMGSFVVNDFLRIATKTFKDCYGKYIEDDKV